MKGFSERRRRNIAVLVLATILVLLVAQVDRANLGQTNFLSGWVLCVLMLLLALFNLRKKLPVLRLGSSASWTQLHIYTGMLSLVLFLVHLDFSLPNGKLEVILAGLFSLVALSGVLGLWLSRSLPARLTRRGENILFERIPAFRAHLRDEVEELARKAAEEHGSHTLPQFYTERLQAFFAGPRNFWSHLLESRRPFHDLEGRLRAMERYLNDEERAILAQIIDRVGTKDDLDYQYAGQALLKYWLFVHIPLTYGLLLCMAVHALTVYVFMGGA